MLRSGCRDLDECTEGGKKCGENTDCINTDGGHHCVCQVGFGGDPCKILFGNDFMLWPSLRRRVQGPGWVPTVPEWKCQPWLSTSYLSESSRRYVEREFLFTSALFSRRILHQPGLQGWDRVQVCPQGPDLCCCGNRRLQKRKGWSWCIESGPKTLWWDHSRMADQGNIYARGNFPLELFCNSKFQENSLFELMFPTKIPSGCHATQISPCLRWLYLRGQQV